MPLCLLFIHPPAHGSEVSPAARNTLDSARIPRASKLLICGLFQKVRVLAQDGVSAPASSFSASSLGAGRTCVKTRDFSNTEMGEKHHSREGQKFR